jgi:hypothetical protein
MVQSQLLVRPRIGTSTSIANKYVEFFFNTIMHVQ